MEMKENDNLLQEICTYRIRVKRCCIPSGGEMYLLAASKLDALLRIYNSLHNIAMLTSLKGVASALSIFSDDVVFFNLRRKQVYKLFHCENISLYLLNNISLL